MTKDELCHQLDGLEYPVRIKPELEGQMKSSGLVAVLGASDDLMEFYGAISDEIGAYNGTTAYLDQNGLIKNKCDDSECPYFMGQLKTAKTIKAIWDPGNRVSWEFKTTIPHSTFRIFEDGAVYCIGIVFHIDELRRYPPTPKEQN